MNTMSDRTLAYITIVIVVLMLPIQFSLPVWVDLVVVFIGYCLIFLITKKSALTLDNLGLTKSQLRNSIKPIIVIPIIIISIIGIVYILKPSNFEDERYHKGIVHTLTYLLVLLPFRTAIFEELIFRGLIFSSFKKNTTTLKAAIISSILFGLWHVLPSRSFNNPSNLINLGSFNQMIIIVLLVLITAVGGLGLCYLREKYDSLYVTIATHWTLNGIAVLFAFLSFIYLQ